MNTGFYRIRWKRGRTFLPVLILLMALFWVQTVFAASTTISAVNITLDLDLKVGEPLPDLNVGYSANSGYEVVIPGNDRYDIDSVKWSSQVDEVTLGGTYTMKIYLDSLNDYSFSGTYSSSKVRVKGGEFVNAQRQNKNRLVVTVKTNPAKGALEIPEDVRWDSTRTGSSRFAYARWDSVKNAAYDVYLYRGSKQVHKVTGLRSTSYDFYPYMTVKGTYSFRVRSIPIDDTAAKYASRSDWEISDELTLEADEISDGSGQGSGMNNAPDSGSSTRPEKPKTDAVGWIQDNGRWYFRYPDGTYLTDSWGKIGGSWYLFDSAGVMQTGWQRRNGVYYYMNQDGRMQTGWLLEGGIWYYLSESGGMVTGWYQVDGKAYFFNESGAMQTGWKDVGGQMYYFYPDGHKAVDTYIDGFYVDQNGVWRRP
ncbi:N-acetylmuramoyl-L-alanine amidase family protein [bacterium 1XD42-94]|nr:N-acetylmuramoyl-L-alanine amidase family protein [bacterium 1XD42-76]NBK05393.1 N-acetylmuramoyl-L-alanine amidase family protein [bacterium 1XD42-94]